MPQFIPATRIRTDKVDIAPGGATVAITVPSDNPFERDGFTSVVTQHTADVGFSGGGAQRSRTSMPLRGGQADLLPVSRTQGRDIHGRTRGVQGLGACVGCAAGGGSLAGFFSENKGAIIAGVIALAGMFYLRRKR